MSLTWAIKPKYLFSGLLICAECGSHYTLLDSSRGYYACSGHQNRGPAICANTKKVRRDRLEAALLDALFNELFTPEAVVYLTRQIDAAIASDLPDLPDQQARLEHDLDQARTELENVLTAIRQGFLTPATKNLLDRCERRVAECDAALRAHAQPPPPTVTSLPTVVARYLSDLRATLNTDVEAARALLARLVGSARAKEMMITGRQVKADEALRIGLADEVVAHESVNERAIALAAEVARGALQAQALTKRAVDRGLDLSVEDGLALERDLFVEVFHTEDSQTGVASFLEKGPGQAEFTGR